jgi:hypothetical protein
MILEDGDHINSTTPVMEEEAKLPSTSVVEDKEKIYDDLDTWFG